MSSPAEIIERMTERFTSGNEVVVERTMITRKEWNLLLALLTQVCYRKQSYHCYLCHEMVPPEGSTCSATTRQHTKSCGAPYVVHCGQPEGHQGEHKPRGMLLSWEDETNWPRLPTAKP